MLRYKMLAFMAFTMMTSFTAVSADDLQGERPVSFQEKMLDFRIDITASKRSAGGQEQDGKPAGAASAAKESLPDFSPGSNPASFELKKEYRTAFPQKGVVGPFTKIFDNQTLLLSTYETYTGAAGQEKLIDSGVHVGLGRPLSSLTDACNADKLDSRTTFFLFGKNGILGVIYWSKSLYNEPGNFEVIMNTGVYANWKAVPSTQVTINCRAEENQWIYKGKVRLNDEAVKQQ